MNCKMSVHHTFGKYYGLEKLELEHRPEFIEAIIRHFESQVFLEKKENYNQAPQPKITPFHTSCCPKITLRQYIKRIDAHAKCSSVCWILAIVYIRKLVEVDLKFAFKRHTAHRLILCSVMIAAKLMDDHYFRNSYFGKVGGISNEDINAMELTMLHCLNYNLFVKEADIHSLLHMVLNSDAVEEDVESLITPGITPKPFASSPNIPCSPFARHAKDSKLHPFGHHYTLSEGSLCGKTDSVNVKSPSHQVESMLSGSCVSSQDSKELTTCTLINDIKGKIAQSFTLPSGKLDQNMSCNTIGSANSLSSACSMTDIDFLECRLPASFERLNT